VPPKNTHNSKVKTYDIFSPADVEREPITQKITEQIEKQKPQGVFVDANQRA
jgi:circadian clock protein KaiC